MKNLKKQLRAAIVQASPVLFDKKATIDKVVRQIMEAHRLPGIAHPLLSLRTDLWLHRRQPE